jgi:hypothetical protein
MTFTYDVQEGVWLGTDVSELTRIRANNFLKYGQPYAPGKSAGRLIR